MTGAGERVDQVITLRFPSYAVRHPEHVCWLNHTMREYYDLWDDFSARLSPQGRIKERVRRTLIRAADTYFFKHHVTKLFTHLRRGPRSARAVERRVGPRCCIRRRRSAPIAATATATTCSSRRASTPLKRARSGAARAGASRRPRGVRVRHRRRRRGRGRGSSSSARELGVDDRVTFVGQLTEADARRSPGALPRRRLRARSTRTTASSRSRRSRRGKAVITCTDSGGPLELVRASARTASSSRRRRRRCATRLARTRGDPALAERLGRTAAPTSRR